MMSFYCRGVAKKFAGSNGLFPAVMPEGSPETSASTKWIRQIQTLAPGTHPQNPQD
jgi:hypothetical protein